MPARAPAGRAVDLPPPLLLPLPSPSPLPVLPLSALLPLLPLPPLLLLPPLLPLLLLPPPLPPLLRMMPSVVSTPAETESKGQSLCTGFGTLTSSSSAHCPSPPAESTALRPSTLIDPAADRPQQKELPLLALTPQVYPLPADMLLRVRPPATRLGQRMMLRLLPSPHV